MYYSNDFKLTCIEMYYIGIYPDTPDGISDLAFHRTIRRWVRLYEAGGEPAVFNKVRCRAYSPEERYALVARVIAGESYSSVAISAGISHSLLRRWVSVYKTNGYNGLCSIKGDSNCSIKESANMKNNNKPKPLTNSEREELLRLRAENEYFKAENEIVKKQIALRHEKWAAQLKAKKQQ